MKWLIQTVSPICDSLNADIYDLYVEMS